MLNIQYPFQPNIELNIYNFSGIIDPIDYDEFVLTPQIFFSFYSIFVANVYACTSYTMDMGLIFLFHCGFIKSMCFLEGIKSI